MNGYETAPLCGECSEVKLWLSTGLMQASLLSRLDIMPRHSSAEMLVSKYVFKPSSAQFPRLFEHERLRLTTFLTRPAAIEHVGSTAIPGLGGKGIIDIAIAGAPADLAQLSGDLQAAGYEFRPHAGTADRRFFRMDRPDPLDGIRRYHIHLMDDAYAEVGAMLAFRDYLRTHPEEATAYAHAKQVAAEQATGDGQRYMDLKTPILEHILQAARRAHE